MHVKMLYNITTLIWEWINSKKFSNAKIAVLLHQPKYQPCKVECCFQLEFLFSSKWEYDLFLPVHSTLTRHHRISCCILFSIFYLDIQMMLRSCFAFQFLWPYIIDWVFFRIWNKLSLFLSVIFSTLLARRLFVFWLCHDEREFLSVFFLICVHRIFCMKTNYITSDFL